MAGMESHTSFNRDEQTYIINSDPNITHDDLHVAALNSGSRRPHTH
jgi:hypothetical protein